MSSAARLFSHSVTRGGFRFPFVDPTEARRVFSRGLSSFLIGCQPHRGKAFPEHGRERARERNERRRFKYIGPSDKFLDFFLYFRDFFAFSFAPLSFPVLPLFTCPHKRELRPTKEGSSAPLSP